MGRTGVSGRRAHRFSPSGREPAPPIRRVVALDGIDFEVPAGPAVGAVAIAILAVVSARVRGFQEAYQLGGVVVLPMVAFW
jgi:hypothetical protein